MSQNTLKVHDLNEDAEFDENGVEVFDEKALVEEEPSDNDLAEEELLSQAFTRPYGEQEKQILTAEAVEFLTELVTHFTSGRYSAAGESLYLQNCPSSGFVQ